MRKQKVMKRRKDGVVQSYWKGNIEEKTVKNKHFRKVLFTSSDEQLVVMSIHVGGDIGMETHHNVDQFLRIEKGRARFIIDGKTSYGGEDDAVVIPKNMRHNVVNIGTTPLKIYVVYSRQNHPKGEIDRTKVEAMIREQSL